MMTNKGPAFDQMRYEVITQKDKDSDEVMLPIPPVLLKRLGWKEGDEIEFGLDAEGHFILKRVAK